MTARPLSLILAAGLLLLIGASGMAAGGGLLGSIANGTALGVDVRGAALALGTMIAGYGFVAVLAGVGLLMLRRWAWRIGILLIAIGLALLAVAMLNAGLDVILGFGVALWGATLVCLLASDTQRAIASRRTPPGPGPG
jgi:hypothetical protein